MTDKVEEMLGIQFTLSFANRDCRQKKLIGDDFCQKRRRSKLENLLIKFSLIAADE